MPIYHIEQTEVDSYDMHSAHVIIANNEEEVRQLAKKEAGSEGPEVWDTAKITKVGLCLDVFEHPYILLSSYHAG